MSASLKTLQGGTRLVFDAVQGITNTAEQLHQRIASTPRTVLSQTSASTGGHGLIAAGVYGLIRGINGGLREGVDLSFNIFSPAQAIETGSRGETQTVAAINGVCGDHLEATGNALATDMSLRTLQQPLPLDAEVLPGILPQASPHLVIMVHGLCLSELSWQPEDRPGIEKILLEHMECTPLYLRYNTGRHISTNGREFSQLLNEVCELWPVPIESISLVGHSMGGLVIRSACCYAQQGNDDWLNYLRDVVCLGTPHHGSPLEKAGHAFETSMKKLPYAEPFLFGLHRSAGIKDLRHGALLDDDWQGHDPDSPRADSRQPVPLLPGVRYFFAAASVGRDHEDPMGRFLGDLLVRPDSAVGLHKSELRKLHIAPKNCRVFHETHHFDLLHDEAVQTQVVEWLQS